MRWTQNEDEEKRLVSVQQELSNALDDGFLIEVTTFDNQTFEGFVSDQSLDNNGATFPSFHEDLTLLTLDDHKIKIDFLDIKNILNVITKSKER